jgi:hypothetical protein
MNVAFADQFQAACSDVRGRVEKMREDPHPGTTLVEAVDISIHEALSHRMGMEFQAKEIRGCCARVDSPAVMYWVPRIGRLFCDDHWSRTVVCGCFSECDACQLPVDDVTFMYLFMGPFIVQAALCVSCSERATRSAD